MITRSLRLAAFAVALASLGCMATPPVAPTPSAAAPATARLAGRVTLPVIALGGGQIIPTGIGGVIAAGGGDVPSARRALLATGLDERPVSGALVLALDPVTLAPLPGSTAVKTDASGAFTLDTPAGSANVLVEAVFRSPDGTRGFRLLAAARPGGSADVSFASTAAVAPLLGTPALATADAAALQAAVEQRVAALPAADAGALVTATVAVAATAVPTGGAGGLVGSPPPTPPALALPSPASSTLPGAVAAVASPLAGVLPSPVASFLAAPAAAVGALASPVGNLVAAPTGVVASTAAALSSPVGQVVGAPAAVLSTGAATPAPVASVLAGVIQTLLPTPAPSHAAAPTPTPKPLIGIL